MSINKLFASHIGIFGNTGSGKSNTLAKIYTELFQECNSDEFKKQSTFIIIDFNGEYISTDMISSSKQVYNLTTQTHKSHHNQYPLSKEHIKNPEILSMLLEATEKTQNHF